MPTYEYECGVCGHHFERFQNMTDEPVNECPECSGQVRRLLGAGAGFIMKGSRGYAEPVATRCGKEQTCCGRGEPCATPSCAS